MHRRRILPLLLTRSTRLMSSTATVASQRVTVPTGHFNLVAPHNTIHDDPLPNPIDQRVRQHARELLPFNIGRPIVPDGSQTLQAVGAPTAAQIKSGKKAPLLFTPLTIRGQPFLKNRIGVSPMCTYSADDGFFNDFHLVHLGQFGLGGAGLVIFEASAVAPEGRISPLCAGLWKDEHIAPMERVTAFLRSQNCVAGIQLAHAGRKASTLPLFYLPRPPFTIAQAAPIELGGWPESVKGPSELPFSDEFPKPHEMSIAEIQTIVQQFAAAAVRAEKAGFGYVELHAAHGYLFSSFLSPTSNQRTDAYGGSFENRIRLLTEAVKVVRSTLSSKIVLGVRLTCEEWVPEGWHLEDTIRLVGELKSLGVDLVDCSSGGNNNHQKIVVGPLYQVPFARGVKKAHPDLTIAAVGLITAPKEAETILEEGDADVVLLAREFLRDPHWSLSAARELGYDMEWAPQYQRAKPSAAAAAAAVPGGPAR